MLLRLVLALWRTFRRRWWRLPRGESGGRVAGSGGRGETEEGVVARPPLTTVTERASMGAVGCASDEAPSPPPPFPSLLASLSFLRSSFAVSPAPPSAVCSATFSFPAPLSVSSEGKAPAAASPTAAATATSSGGSPSLRRVSAAHSSRYRCVVASVALTLSTTAFTALASAEAMRRGVLRGVDVGPPRGEAVAEAAAEDEGGGIARVGI